MNREFLLPAMAADRFVSTGLLLLVLFFFYCLIIAG
jgi:hypothetical protein